MWLWMVLAIYAVRKPGMDKGVCCGNEWYFLRRGEAGNKSERIGRPI